MLKEFETTRTTITVPNTLIERVQYFIDSGAIPSRNALIIAALERYLVELERLEIDRQFDAMAEDEAYQTLQADIADAFAESDWEALNEAET